MNAEQYAEKYRIRPQDLQNIQELWVMVKDHVEEVYDAFQEWLINHPKASHFFTDEKFIKHNRVMRKKQWARFFRGVIDEGYIKSCVHLGKVHARIGLDLDHYYNGIVEVTDLFEQLFERLSIPSKYQHAFRKLLFLEMGIVSSTYNNRIQKILTEQNEVLKEMSTPVTRLRKDILFLPIVGIIDSQRAQHVMQTILQKIEEVQSKILIIDIAGIAVMDTAVANYLIKITKATHLMGCESVIAGISSVVAQTIVELGIATGDLKTTGNLEDAITYAFARLGSKIIQEAA